MNTVIHFTFLNAKIIVWNWFQLGFPSFWTPMSYLQLGEWGHHRFWSFAVFCHGLQGADALTPLSSHLSEGPLFGPALGPGWAPLLPALVSLLHGLPCQVSLAFLSYSAILNTHLCCAAAACPWCSPQAAADPHAMEDTEEPSRPENIQSLRKTRFCELGLRRARADWSHGPGS